MRGGIKPSCYRIKEKKWDVHNSKGFNQFHQFKHLTCIPLFLHNLLPHSITKQNSELQPTITQTWLSFSSEEMPRWRHANPLLHQTWMWGMCELDSDIETEALYLVLVLLSYWVPGIHWSFFGSDFALLVPTHLLYCYMMWLSTTTTITRAGEEM